MQAVQSQRIRGAVLLAASFVVTTACSGPHRSRMEPQLSSPEIPAPAASLAVLSDGEFTEWQTLAPAWEDPPGDGAPGGLDLGTLHLADDGEALFLALDVGRETILQNGPDKTAGSDLTLWISEEGRGRRGSEVGIRFGRREVLVHRSHRELERLTPGAFGLQTLPTHSSERFEIRLPLDRWPGADTLRLVLQDGNGDRLPDAGVLIYRPSGEHLPPPEPIPLERPEGNTTHSTVRLLSLNLNRRLGDERSDPSDAEAHARILRATQPDVIAFQELYEWSAEQAAEWVTGVLPGPWHAAKSGDCVTVSRFPIADSAPIDNNLVTRIALPETFTARDLVLFNAHTPCCDNDEGRDREMDHLAATWRDLLAGRGPFPLDPRAPAIFLGDFNLVGFRRQIEALRDGVFVDPANGPPFSPGRERGSLATVPLRHTHRRLAYTWRNDDSEFPPGRLDWIFYTSDTAEPVRSYILDTTTAPTEVLTGWGLEPDDTLRASDHRVLVADFRFLE